MLYYSKHGGRGMYFGEFYLDKEKDIIVTLDQKGKQLFYTLKAPYHKSGNLIRNLSKLCNLPLTKDENDLFVIQGIVPSYVDGMNRTIYIFRLGNTKVANIYLDGTIEMKASIPSISKTLMSQTKNYNLDITKTIIKTYVLSDCKFETDLHTHMNAVLAPDTLISLGIVHQIRYPLYYIKKLNLRITKKQQEYLTKQRLRVEKQFVNSSLEGKALLRRIDDNTFINFADLILNNLENADYNIPRIRASLSILKDGQAVFTNLEKVYLYRYVFTKGIADNKPIKLKHYTHIKDVDIQNTVRKMLQDKQSDTYHTNSLFQDKLLWMARTYQAQGIYYVEVSDTTLVKEVESIQMLKEVHEIMPKVTAETGVFIRFLAAIRRIPLTIVKDQVTVQDYLQENLRVLRAIMLDPYVAGSDFVGEEINAIQDLKPAIKEIVKMAKEDPTFVIRIHAGENDSLKDNVANSIQCIKESLQKGQKMPHVRIGHGLYTTNLKSKKGKALIKELKENDVVLEFQITSNVRLNNLNTLQEHPLKQYLNAGIHCVQGTDGGAIYGTNCIDEQLSLEKLLNLTIEDLAKMKATDSYLAKEGIQAFHTKEKKFRKMVKDKSWSDVLFARMQKTSIAKMLIASPDQLNSSNALMAQIEELPWDKLPVVIVGGSFNNDQRKTKMLSSSKKLIDCLLTECSPQEVFFVIGHTMTGYEKYLVENNTKGFQIFAIVPSYMEKTQVKKLQKANIKIRVSTESSPMGTYKSFNYEIFERRPSVVFAFDGNASAANLVQEAHNGKGKAMIFVSGEAPVLVQKAESLQGYVQVFHNEEEAIKKFKVR